MCARKALHKNQGGKEGHLNYIPIQENDVDGNIPEWFIKMNKIGNYKSRYIKMWLFPLDWYILFCQFPKYDLIFLNWETGGMTGKLGQITQPAWAPVPSFVHRLQRAGNIPGHHQGPSAHQARPPHPPGKVPTGCTNGRRVQRAHADSPTRGRLGSECEGRRTRPRGRPRTPSEQRRAPRAPGP